MKLNISTDDLHLKFEFVSNKNISIDSLEQLFMKKYFMNDSRLNTNKIIFYDINKEIFLNDTIQFTLGTIVNIKILIGLKFIYEKDAKEEIKIEDLIAKITGAKKKLKKIKTIKRNSLYFYKLKLKRLLNDSVNFNENSFDFIEEYSDVEPDELLISKLTDAGLSLGRAQMALILSRNNLTIATELISHHNFEFLYRNFCHRTVVCYFL